ncbi:MAG TPA: hypothetical protein DEF12_12645 [Rhodobacteraceae bacterium]|jgi:hypothetical protein|nr:hypothetical protein [Paracoccaceae bacterium]HBV55863.1 hypothetical protein [Paracoccaceae bacterium]
MTEVTEIDGKALRLEEMLAEKLGLAKGPLHIRARRAGRRLPAGVRAGITRIAAAQEMVRHPKLVARVDLAGLEKDYRAAMTFLAAIDPADRRKGFWLGLAGGLVFNLLAFGALVLIILRLRGFV